MVGAYHTADIPRPEQVSDACETLDMMLKSWQTDGLLWLKQFIYVALAASKGSYVIGAGSTDTVTTDAAGTVPYLQRPTRIYAPTRREISTGYEVPLRQISRSEWSEIVNKTSSGPPVQVYYDPQISSGKLYVWPVPTGATYQVACSVDRIIEDAGTDENTLDVPPEWIETVKFNLALRIGLEYGLPSGDMDRLERNATAMAAKMFSSNTDNSPVFFAPGR